MRLITSKIKYFWSFLFLVPAILMSCENSDGAFECYDECPSDPSKTDPGECGTCGSGQVCENHTCVDNDLSYQCDIVCTDGKIRSDSCEPSILVPSESLCEMKRDICCIEDMTSCPSLCDEDEILDGDAYIHLDDITCRDYLVGLTPTDYDCIDPFPHVPDTCCKSSFPSSPPVDPDPCYDLCGDDLQMVGSRLLDDFPFTCFEYASSLNADSAECTAPDPMIVDRCCDSPRSIPSNNLCCLCDGCSPGVRERSNLYIGPDYLTCIGLDFHMSINLKSSDTECTAKKKSFHATCCDSNYTPPPPVTQGEEETFYNPCTNPNPPGYCEAGSYPKCNLCEDGSYPKNPSTITAVAYIPGNPTCADLHWMGLYKHLPPAMCYPVQNFMAGPCGCN